ERKANEVGHWESRDNPPWKFFSGNTGETPWRAFEGELLPRLNLTSRSPQLSDFEPIGYEINPESLNLVKALRIEASESTSDSFSIHIHSTVSSTQVQARARFKVKESVFTNVLPEAK